MRYILSDENENQKGSIVRTSGIDLTDFLANPVMLQSHNPEKIMGKWKNILIEGDKLTAEPEWDMDDPEAVLQMRKCEKDLSTGCSIGFTVLSAEVPDDPSQPVVITKSKLLEASVTPIPALGSARKYMFEGKTLEFENREQLSLALGFKPKVKEEVKEVVNLENTELITLKADNVKKDFQIITLQSQLIKLNNDIQNLNSDIENVKLENKKLLVERKKEQIELFLNDAKREGQITLEEKTSLTKLAMKDFDAVKTLVKTKPRKNPIDLKEYLKFDSGRSTWNYHDWVANDLEGLTLMKEQDSNRYYKLYNSI